MILQKPYLSHIEPVISRSTTILPFIALVKTQPISMCRFHIEIIIYVIDFYFLRNHKFLQSELDFYKFYILGITSMCTFLNLLTILKYDITF